MKKLFAIIAFAFTFFSSVTTANAQGYGTDPQMAYDHCRMFTQQGNEAYRSGCFGTAKFNYEQALNCNIDCTHRKYISDRELNNKIDDCVFAMCHGNKTREQVREEMLAQQYQQSHCTEVSDAAAGAVIAGALIGAVVSAATHDGPHHGPHHDFHHHDFPHHDFHHDGPHHHDHHFHF